VYFDAIWPFIKVPRFYSQVDRACDELHNIRLPRDPTISLDDWLKNELGEDKWNWQYKNEINKWENCWFKSKSTLEEINQRWQLQKNEIEKFGVYISTFFTSLYDSVKWLKNLNEEYLNINLNLCHIEAAALALSEGTKLKHLLMEQGFSHIEIANAIR